MVIYRRDRGVAHWIADNANSKWSYLHVMACYFSTARFPVNLAAAYIITKTGVEAFSDVLRREMHPWGIKVSILEPGAHQTPMLDPSMVERQFRQGWNDLSAELKRDYGSGYLEKGTNLFLHSSFSISDWWRTLQIERRCSLF